MSTATTVKLRASSLRDCPRKAVYEATDAPARGRTPREERFLYRGKSIGRDYTIFLAASNGFDIYVASGPSYWVPPDLAASSAETAGLIAEKPVRWAHGVGHADVYLPGTRTIIECLSSANASDAMLHSKLLQAVLYTEHDDEATNCRLVVIDPADFTEEQIVVDPASRQYRTLLDEMRERIAQIDRWNQTGDLPTRVCGKPSEAYGHFCLHAQHCFDGWEPREVDELEADETLVDTLTRFDRVREQISGLAKETRTLEAEKKELQQVLEQFELPVGTVRLGPFLVSRSHTQRKATFEWEKAEMAGVFEPGLYGEFFKAGSSYSTFKTERAEPTDDDFDYGEGVPF